MIHIIKKNYNNLSNVALLLLFLVTLFYSGIILKKHYDLITYPLQCEFREAVTPMCTSLLLEGKNPYTMEFQPEYAQAYGIIYNLVAIPISYVLGSSLQTHRFVSGIFIFLCLFIFVLWLKDLKLHPILIFSNTLILYMALTFQVLSLNRPDTLALFFVLLAIYIPFKKNYTYPSLLLSAILFILAFYTKSYFLALILCFGIYLFCFINRIKAVLYTLIFLFIFCISIALVSYIFPLFFYLTVFAFINYDGGSLNSMEWSITQFLNFFYLYKGLTLAILVNLVFIFLNKNHRILLKNNTLYFLVCTNVVMSLLLFFVLGKVIGAFMTYFFTLFLPFFLLISAFILKISSTNFYIKMINIAAIAFTIGLSKAFLFPPKIMENEEEWVKAEKIIENNDKILSTPMFAMMLFEKNKKVYDQGLTGQFGFAGGKVIKNEFIHSLFPRSEEIKVVNENFKNDIITKINSQYFNLILKTDNFNDWLYTKKDLENSYYPTDTLKIRIPYSRQYWDILVYEPIKK